ncbi:MAG: ATP-binding protein [Clostridiales bacterium]|nr:ATP-binding protein [Clostridiales bacterium]
MDYFEQASRRGFIIYDSLREDKIIRRFISLCKEVSEGRLVEAEREHDAFVSALAQRAEKDGLRGDIFAKYITSVLLSSENVFSLACENERPLFTLREIVKNDIESALFFMRFDIDVIYSAIDRQNVIKNYIPSVSRQNVAIDDISAMSDAQSVLNALKRFYAENGCGALAFNNMLKLEDEIVGVKNSDPVTFEDIICYDAQKSALRRNTLKFVNRLPANNMLLVGANGTGKSSCVKALANEFAGEGLRVLSVNSSEISRLREVFTKIAERGKRFIVFIDDLSFDTIDYNYLFLKSVLEGDAETLPPNALIYATSNRRNLVKESWDDRASDVHVEDTLNEKISLADRFGITISFPRPTPEQYLDIVRALAEREGVKLTDDKLRSLAFRWEISKKGFSGRAAKQFIKSLI